MEVYVDEKPKKCWECKYVSKYGYCDLLDVKVFWDCVFYDCPLHSLSNHDQQVHADERKKVVEEVRTLCEKEKEENDLAWLGFNKLNRILDQVEKGEKQ